MLPARGATYHPPSSLLACCGCVGRCTLSGGYRNAPLAPLGVLCVCPSLLQDLIAGYGSDSDGDVGSPAAPAAAVPALAPVLRKFPVADSAPMVTYDPTPAVTHHGVPMVGVVGAALFLFILNLLLPLPCAPVLLRPLV